VISESVGFLPNVATDTDLAIAPTPTGVETLTQLRSASSPHSQTFDLDLPAGATLEATEDGGAVVMDGENVLVSVSSPSAIDATGAKVPISLEVAGHSLTLTVAPDESANLPILVDPLFQTYEWAKSSPLQSGICNSSFTIEGSSYCNEHEEWSYEHTEKQSPPHMRIENRDYASGSPVPYGTPGIFIGTKENLTTGDKASVNYTVPRYFTDQKAFGVRPTSFISQMTLSNLDWNAWSSHLSPYIVAGIWDPINKTSVSYYSHEGLEGHGLTDMSWQYKFPNPNPNTKAKVGYVSVQGTETQPNQNTELYVGSASIQLGDIDIPEFGLLNGPSQWINQIAPPVNFITSDTGLGVQSLTATAGPPNSWKTSRGCIGVGDAACPQTWKSSDVGSPALKYEPAAMPQGINNMNVVAEDPVGNKSASGVVQIKVDHTAPVLAPLSGTLTEQDKLGTTASQYTLKYTATDGDSQAATALTPFGSAGTGPGQMQEPRGIATDASGNLWVVDRANARVMKYDSNGNYLMQFGSPGSGNGQFNDPRAIAIAPNGTIWVSDMGNNNVQKFTSTGQFVGRIIDQSFADPYGVATDSAGHVWVSDITTDKLYEFNEGGTLIRLATTTDANGNLKPAEMKSATGLATDPNGNVWLVDYLENRVQKYSSTGKFLMQFGSTGAGAGQLETPLAIAVAPSGHLLVTEEKNNRVDVFQPNGVYLRQFGAAGSGSGGLSAPKGIALGAGNAAFVVDPGNHRVAKWSHADLDPQSGVVATEVKVDGQLVEPKYAPGCATKDCAIGREWTLKSSNYASGQHNVEVIATDGVGLSTTRSLAVTTVQDTVKPKLTAVSSYFLTPKGWMEQDTYSYSTSVSDVGGYGVTSYVFKIDGKVVKSTTQACPTGGCGASLSGSIDMSAYEGGAHPAELVATDAAGNTYKVAKTFNVNPAGNITAGEADDTLEAVDITAESAVVAPTYEVLEPEQMEHGDNPALQQSGTSIQSIGTPDTTTMTTDPADGFTIHSPDGATEISPVVSPSSSDVLIAEDVAAVASNVAKETDSVVRPQYNGVQTFAAIRSLESPEGFSWSVGLGEGQTLRLINSAQAEVVYEDQTRAFLITAEEAHDAVGASVPTALQVSGNILTLKVDHRSKAFTYPVVAGQGWETSYEAPIIVEGPEDETEIWEKEQEELRLEHEALEAQFPGPSAPPITPPITKRQAERLLAVGPYNDPDVVLPPEGNGTATASRIRTFQLYRSVCGLHCDHWKAKVYNASYIRGSDWVKWEPGTEVHGDVDHDAKFAAIIQHQIHNCGTVGPTFVRKGDGEHLIAYLHFTIETWWNPITDIVTVSPAQKDYALQGWVYPNGFQERHVKDWEAPGNGSCPTVAG
jgi:hypothetical protein